MISWFKKQTKGVKIILIVAVVFWSLVGIGALASPPKEKEVAHVGDTPAITATTPKATSSTAEVKKVEPAPAPTPPAPTPPPPPPPDPAAEAAAYRAECKNIEFRALEKNPDAYNGQKYSVQGQVVQIMEGANETDIRLNVTPPQYGSYWDDTIYVVYRGKTDALDKSIINVYGEVSGKYTYTSQANYNISLPLIDAKYIDIVTL